jgi:hypothetical protein
MKLLLSSIFLLILAPCNKSKSIAASGTQSADLKKMEVIYTCTPCFGKCPAFTLTISGESQTMTYVGKSNTEKMGTWTKAISGQQLAEIISTFEKEIFSELNESYLGNISDFPSKYITLTYKDKTKKVQDRSGGPENLHRLEKMLQRYADSEGWLKLNNADN